MQPSGILNSSRRSSGGSRSSSRPRARNCRSSLRKSRAPLAESSNAPRPFCVADKRGGESSMPEDGTLPAIAMFDVRATGPVRRALDAPERLAALREACLTSLPSPVRPVLPTLDVLARRWLTRSASRYVVEVASIAAAVPYSGVWFPNGSYCWGCTTLAREETGVPWLVRTLDWPFAGLGRFLELARMRGPAGEFHSLTWPGYV